MNLKKQTTFYLLIIVDVSASTEAFVGTVCLIAVRRLVSGRRGCRRCGHWADRSEESINIRLLKAWQNAGL